MQKSNRKQSNELEFQGQAIVWLNDEIAKRPGLKLEKATQEKPRKSSGKRSDLIVWTDRAAELAFLAVELKTPSTPINDPVLFADAIEKAQHWNAEYLAIWNMRELEVYKPRLTVNHSCPPMRSVALRFRLPSVKLIG